MSCDDATLRAATDCALVRADGTTERFVELAVEARETPPGQRAPLNLAVVIDRSGSMHGDKLRFAQEAALHVARTLAAGDRQAVVAYDDQVEVIAESAQMDAGSRRRVSEAIRALFPRGCTDLHGGWLCGAQQASAWVDGASVSRVLLLSDGLANRGDTDPESLAFQAEGLAERGVGTSTFGVGLDFNEHLLAAMADRGRGRFYFIEHPARIPEIFRQELGEMLSVVARSVVVRVEHPREVHVELLGGIPHQVQPGMITVPLGELVSGELRELYLRASVPPGTPGARVEVRAVLAFQAVGGGGGECRTKAVFTWAPADECERAPREQRVRQAAAEVDLALAADEALALERAGRNWEAREYVASRMAAHDEAMPAYLGCELRTLSERMADGLSEIERKRSHADMYGRRSRRTRKP